jgi:hypothetical protein
MAVRRRATLHDTRGYALITVLFLLFLLSMILLAFDTATHAEMQFAMTSRNGMVAFNLAEAGVQEAMARLNTFGEVPGQASFTNSLAGTTGLAGSTGSVTFESTMQANPYNFPILSTASYAGSQRKLRVVMRASYQAGWGSIVFGPQMAASGDVSPTIGDLYSQSTIAFASYAESPLCSIGSTDVNLEFPQVIAGTTITAGAGASVTSPCGGPSTVIGTATTECAMTSPSSQTEVAPTPCPGGRSTVGGVPLPVNWHPMTPIAMPTADFTAIVNTPALALQLFGITLTAATQNGTAVTYQPAGAYWPSYWTTVPWTTQQVVLIIAKQPFCVAPLLGLALPTPAIIGTCLPGFDYYGSQAGGTGQTTRYVDWGLVANDLTRMPAETFFEPSQCSTCPGNQNGIRYVPVYPTVNVLGNACQPSFTPGSSIFDKVNMADGVTCNAPTQTISSSSVAFTGSLAAPETLSIDNGGMGAVSITSVLPYGTNLTSMTCGNTNFFSYNWGLIFATGDLNLSNMVFSGFIYSTGTVYLNGTVLLQGGVFATSVQPGASPSNQVSDAGTLKFCSQGSPVPLMTPRIYTFSPQAWEDVPANQP